jgi:hypothetical protein
MGETITHEKAYAAPHRGSTTQQLQGRDDDRDRPWGCLEPLALSQFVVLLIRQIDVVAAPALQLSSCAQTSPDPLHCSG